MIELTEPEQRVLGLFRQLTPKERAVVLIFIRTKNCIPAQSIVQRSQRLYYFFMVAFPECLQNFSLNRRKRATVGVKITQQ